jgi:uncharacterized protein YndB with AHSA1/START domain
VAEERVVTLDAAFDVIRKSIVVEVPQEHAFQVFTAGVDTWWPRAYHIGPAELGEMIIEPKEGGRCYGRDAEGEWDWGRVRLWDPPSRVVLVWQLTAEWTYDPSFETDVDVRFVAEGPNRTRVDLEHRDLDRFGDGLAQFREQGAGGWTLMLDAFATAAEAKA